MYLSNYKKLTDNFFSTKTFFFLFLIYFIGFKNILVHLLYFELVWFRLSDDKVLGSFQDERH